MSEAPKVIWAWESENHPLKRFWAKPGDLTEKGRAEWPQYIRADIAQRLAEALFASRQYVVCAYQGAKLDGAADETLAIAERHYEEMNKAIAEFDALMEGENDG